MLNLSRQVINMTLWLKRLLQGQSSSLGITIFKRKLNSALYVTGDKASETYAVLTPHLDFDQRFEDIASLKRNVKLRGMDMNVEEIKMLWDFMKDVHENKMQLEERRVEVANKMRALKSMPSSIGLDVDMQGKQLRIEGKMIRDDLKAVMKGLWGIEGNAVMKALALPNNLHADTPTSEKTVVHVFGTKSECSCKSHLEKGVILSLIKYCNQLNYYMLGEAALFELGALDYFGTQFQKSEFLQFCNTDFARSVVVEGIGVEHKNPMSSIILKREDESTSDVDRLHLMGGASLASFAAFHAKQSVHPSSLPLRYHTSGRQYIPNPSRTDERGLFGVWQASAVQLFICSSNNFQDMMQEFNSVLKKLISIYEGLELHFRVAYLPANALNPWESLRASIQMYSSYDESYIEVGNLSLCDDYISKRLLMCYQENDKDERRFMNIVSGTAMSVPKLLGCILEQNQDDVLIIPKAIKDHMLNSRPTP